MTMGVVMKSLIKILRSRITEEPGKEFNVAMYVRSATRSQTENCGIERQKYALSLLLAALRNFNELSDNITIKKYEDSGILGLTMERPGMKDLLHDIHLGNIDTLLITELDRISRDVLQVRSFCRDLKSYGVKLYLAASGPKEFEYFGSGAS